MLPTKKTSRFEETTGVGESLGRVSRVLPSPGTTGVGDSLGRVPWVLPSPGIFFMHDVTDITKCDVLK